MIYFEKYLSIEILKLLDLIYKIEIVKNIEIKINEKYCSIHNDINESVKNNDEMMKINMCNYII